MTEVRSEGNTKILSAHYTRRSAQKEERRVQKALDEAWKIINDQGDPAVTDGVKRMLEANGIPAWAHGARVEKAGFFQYGVVATEYKGH
jgi:hypothetical protein